MRTFTIAMAVCLAGCATQQLTTGLQGVMGKPIDVLVSYWGFSQQPT